VLARFNCAILLTHYLEKSFVMFLLPLVRHVFFCVIIIVCTVVSIEGWVGLNNRLKRAPRGSCS